MSPKSKLPPIKDEPAGAAAQENVVRECLKLFSINYNDLEDNSPMLRSLEIQKHNCFYKNKPKKVVKICL